MRLPRNSYENYLLPYYIRLFPLQSLSTTISLHGLLSDFLVLSYHFEIKLRLLCVSIFSSNSRPLFNVLYQLKWTSYKFI